MRLPSTIAISSSLSTHFELIEFGERTIIKTSHAPRTETILLHQESPPYRPPSESYQTASSLPNVLRKSCTTLWPKSSSLLPWLTKMESVSEEKCLWRGGRSCIGGRTCTVAYPLLRVEIAKVKIESKRSIPPRLLGPASIEALDLHINSDLSALLTPKAANLPKLASQLAIGSL